MNVSLTTELEKFVKEKVKSGNYQTASEVVREALRGLQERDQFRQLRFAELRREIQIGLEQLDRGEGKPLDIKAVKAEGRRRQSGKNGTG